MRPLLMVLLSVLASPVFADDPPAPISVSGEWDGPSYNLVENSSGARENWHYEAGGATLLVSRYKCSPCEPVGPHSIEIESSWPNDEAVIIQTKEYPAALVLSVEPRDHHITSAELVSDEYVYRVQLVVLNSVPANESMRLQQGLLRMVRDWQPE